MKFFLRCLQLLPLLIIFTLESLLKLFIPKKRKSVTGEIVLITGAGHGIGRLTAYEFAKLKSKLVLWDINKHGIEDTAAECRRLGAKAHAFVVDCSNREDIYSSAKKVKEEIGDVSILVNNAGVVYTSDLFSTQDPQIEKTFEVNVLAHFWTTKAFLPVMMKNNHGHIVTVASAAGHTGVPFLLAYCSSKFAAVGFHKALTEELAALERTGVKTTCLCPNFINTGFIKNPSTALGPTLEPEEVVDKLVNGILTEQKMIFIPSCISFLTVVEKILPERFLAFLKRKIDIRFDAVIGYKTKGQ
ncbi:estradiol 17-beta-dehydrogenase 11 [Ursus americanus]|uniref:Estradiol 17-beta-dehydrogenase 11 n=2 Tax=Ursus TaxID=9639 RepID=A0A384DBJ1_URSMA|nr:estradiol 17-beta-dehydrogenase 11 isoform X1 [Ursus maritimus]XP_045647496.1 estradiol 17-beta-dehydrogenase 11 [Ursus americanus]XP_045647503.1 estradiol 17-beta-dehydrogenase 11 [Ursus americanus]XP_048067871.1 estradiol 17-beta-dehydrogenase 11 [Ursus arctos]XP_048067872.1 estradiol 17-beta-dehydrogenase 11 [Ursus arctos]XP_048067873.1 estradiol 17-beta-dehydrogenase 11 [Ursus arctos]XP_057165889.1 estradiol 17-beta-dehydrogenase 11 [Ursus arctos]